LNPVGIRAIAARPSRFNAFQLAAVNTPTFGLGSFKAASHTGFAGNQPHF
jgi:hypothetical protein